MMTRCQAIVIGFTDYGEADRIVTLLSPEVGKFSAIARNARKSRKRFGGCLEIFAELSIQVRLKESLSALESVDCVSLNASIRNDLCAIGYAAYACEVVDRLLPEKYPAPRVCRLLGTWLRHLAATAPSASDRRFFEINLLNILGYRPALDECARCGESIDPGSDVRVSVEAGGCLCTGCAGGGSTVAAGTVSTLRRCLASGRFGSVVFTDRGLCEAGAFLDALLATHWDRPLKSAAFLAETVAGCGDNSTRLA